MTIKELVRKCKELAKLIEKKEAMEYRAERWYRNQVTKRQNKSKGIEFIPTLPTEGCSFSMPHLRGDTNE